MEDFLTNYGIIACYILLAVTVLVSVIFPIIQLVQNPKNIKSALISVGAMVVVVGISYALASDTNPSNMPISATEAKQVGTGLYAFYILAAGAIGSLVYSEVAKFFK